MCIARGLNQGGGFICTSPVQRALLKDCALLCSLRRKCFHLSVCASARASLHFWGADHCSALFASSRFLPTLRICSHFVKENDSMSADYICVRKIVCACRPACLHVCMCVHACHCVGDWGGADVYASTSVRLSSNSRVRGVCLCASISRETQFVFLVNR